MPKNILVSSIVSPESPKKKELEPSGEEISLTFSDISQPKPSISHSKTPIEKYSAPSTQKLNNSNISWDH